MGRSLCFNLGPPVVREVSSKTWRTLPAVSTWPSSLQSRWTRPIWGKGYCACFHNAASISGSLCLREMWSLITVHRVDVDVRNLNARINVASSNNDAYIGPGRVFSVTPDLALLRSLVELS